MPGKISRQTFLRFLKRCYNMRSSNYWNRTTQYTHFWQYFLRNRAHYLRLSAATGRFFHLKACWYVDLPWLDFLRYMQSYMFRYRWQLQSIRLCPCILKAFRLPPPGHRCLYCNIRYNRTTAPCHMQEHKLPPYRRLL